MAYRNYKNRSIGYQKALEHIHDAHKLSNELGGTDKDVKQYFYSLDKKTRTNFFTEYGIKFGEKAKNYAIETFPKWKNGKVKMSGTVAERLFSILPSYMPLDKKYELTENLWKYVSSSSEKKIYIGKNVDFILLRKEVEEFFSENLVAYKIPENMESRFEWLSQGDVKVKQKLLNHFLQKEKILLEEVFNNKIPVLIDHFISKKGNYTTRYSEVLVAGSHKVTIIFDERVDGISYSLPIEKSRNLGCFFFIAVYVFIIWSLFQ